MLYTTVDSLVRGVLLKERKPLHWYVEYLSHACSGIKRLNTTTLKNVNSKKLTVNSYKAVDIPCDYVDWVRVGFSVGENVRPLIHDDNLNRLNNYDSSGNKVVYENVLPDGTDINSIGYMEPYYYNAPYQYGSINYTPLFGYDPSRSDWKFVVLPNRGSNGEIQLSANFPYDNIILDYITDGLEADSATRVDPLAVPALEKWIMWQSKIHSRNFSDSERREAERRWEHEWKLLRAAKNDLTKAEIIHAVRSGSHALIKN